MPPDSPATLQIGFSLDELRAAIGNRLFLTVPEVSKIVRTDERTTRRAIEAGQIPAIKINNTTRVPVAKFLALCGLAPAPAEETPGRLRLATGGDAA